MTFHISKTKHEGVTRAGAPSVALNVVLESDIGVIAFTGFRLIKGKLVPPAVKLRTGRYVDTVMMDEVLLRKLLADLRAGGFPVAETDEEALTGVLTQERLDRILQ